MDFSDFYKTIGESPMVQHAREGHILRMKPSTPLLSVAFSVFSLVAPLSTMQAASILWSEDFQAQTPGVSPSGAVITGPASKSIVVDSTTSVTDPFGPAGNRSLMMEKTQNGGTYMPRVEWTIPVASEFRISFDAYTVFDIGAGLDKPILNIFAYKDTTALIGPRFWVQEAGALVLGDGASLLTVTGVWTHNQVNHFDLEIFEDDTYSLSINGTLMQATVGDITKDRFAFNSSPEGGLDINRFQVSIADSGRVGARVFVDNLVMIPEPSTVALTAFGLIAGLLSWRKRRIAG